MVFGQKCWQWIIAFYHERVSSVKSKDLISAPFEQLYHSNRQGCPLFPWLFILPLEPLARAIWRDRGIPGVSIDDHDFKQNVYADDILLTLSNP